MILTRVPLIVSDVRGCQDAARPHPAAARSVMRVAREEHGVALYAALCGVFIGLRGVQAALARRRAPRTIITAADLALARARRWCSLRGRRAAKGARRV